MTTKACVVDTNIPSKDSACAKSAKGRDRADSAGKAFPVLMTSGASVAVNWVRAKNSETSPITLTRLPTAGKSPP